MTVIAIKPEVYWVGVKDWDLRIFHGYKTQQGSSYNAYFIKDQKTALVDTVKAPFWKDMLNKLKSISDPTKLDYIICNHVEMDHSGLIPKLAKIAPNVKIIASPAGAKALNEHFFSSKLNIQTVKTGETLSLGSTTLQFFHMPMVHWPDSMATYVKEKQLLLPNDAFGQHYCTEQIYTSKAPKDTLFFEASKYYANIVYPYGNQVLKALDTLTKLNFNMIAPSHGLIWDNHLEKIILSYKKWANYENNNKALIVYDTMWHSTEEMAKTIASVFEDKKIPTLVRNLSTSHYSDVIVDVLEAQYVCIGSPTLNNEILPSMAAFLTYLKGLKPKNKISFIFGSYGWAKKALGTIEEILKELKWELPEAPYYQKYVPTPDDLNNLREYINKLIIS